MNTVIQPGLAVRAQCHPPYQAIKTACVNVIPRARPEPDDIVQLQEHLFAVTGIGESLVLRRPGRIDGGTGPPASGTWQVIIVDHIDLPDRSMVAKQSFPLVCAEHRNAQWICLRPEGYRGGRPGAAPAPQLPFDWQRRKWLSKNLVALILPTTDAQ